MLFSISGVLLFSLWIFLGACAPAFLDLKAWGVPQFLRGILIFVSVLLGPIVPLVTVLCGSVKMLINRKREAEKRREIERLNQIMLENSRGNDINLKVCFLPLQLSFQDGSHPLRLLT